MKRMQTILVTAFVFAIAVPAWSQPVPIAPPPVAPAPRYRLYEIATSGPETVALKGRLVRPRTGQRLHRPE